MSADCAGIVVVGGRVDHHVVLLADFFKEPCRSGTDIYFGLDYGTEFKRDVSQGSFMLHVWPIIVAAMDQSLV